MINNGMGTHCGFCGSNCHSWKECTIASQALPQHHPSLSIKSPAKVLGSDRVVMVDCDDTLCMWNDSEYPMLPQVEIPVKGKPLVRLNEKNIKLVVKLAKMGYTIVVWSATGWEWAKAVGMATGLDQYVSLYMSKSRYYLDDRPANTWMGERIWRDPITGKDSFYERDGK